MRDFLSATRERVLVYDGGMGATLEQFDLSLERDYRLPGRCHEALVLNRPDVIEGVHQSMLEAGAHVLETDTFQASRLKLAEWGLEAHTHEINLKAAEIARKAAGDHRFVAGSIGPTGFLPASDDPSLGQIQFPELAEVFHEQARGLLAGGVDLIIIETAQDILEVKAAIFGIREAFKEAGRRSRSSAACRCFHRAARCCSAPTSAPCWRRSRRSTSTRSGSTAPPVPRTCETRSASSASTPASRCTASPTQACRCRAPTARRSSPSSQSRWRMSWASSSSVMESRSSGAAAAPPPPISRCWPTASRTALPASAPRAAPHVSSMIDATGLVQDPRPTLVGERVNSQGSRKAKEMLLADDYDGILTVAEDQVTGGAHVLDVCVALTERQDEAEQMRQVVKRISLTQPAPIQVDSTEPDVIETALQQIPGRAIVNSINLEAGRDKLDRVVPIAKAHGAALIALTIDEVGMAKTAERKLEIAQRLTELCCDEHGMDPEALIFDCLTFTLTTGDEEWRPSAVATIEGIRLIKDQIPGVKTSLGVSNVSFGVGLPARSALNSVFLHHCVEAGLDLAMVNPNHITPYGEIPEQERELADDLVFNRREDALERFIAHFESKGASEEAPDKADPTEGMEPEEALHFHILRRKKEGVEDWIDAASRRSGRSRRSTRCCCRR